MPGRDGCSGLRHQRTVDPMAGEDFEQSRRRYVRLFIIKISYFKVNDNRSLTLRCSHRSTVLDTDLHGAIESEAHERACTFTHPRSSFLHHRRHTAQIGWDLGDRTSSTLRGGGG